MRSLRKGLIALVLPVITLLTWWLISSLHLFPQLFLPTPHEMALAIRDASPNIRSNAVATAVRLTVGFGAGSLVGYSLGLVMIFFPVVRMVLGPAVDSSRVAPATAALPFFLLWFGFSTVGQILFIGLGVSLIVTSAVIDAGSAVSPHLIRTAQTFQASRWQLARTVIMPGLLPQLAPTLRICLGVAGSLTVVSEFMGADYGLGVLLDLSRRTLRTENLVLFSFVLGSMVLLLDLALRSAIGYGLRWMPKSSEALEKLERPSMKTTSKHQS